MSNNSNPYDLDGNQVRNKTWENDVVRATVIDVLPDIHSVRVNPRGDNAPIVAPVLTPMYGMHILPQEKERVTLLYITENVPVVVGGVYLADGPNPPEAEEGEAVFGNSTGARLDMRPDGSIGMKTGELSDPIDIDFQVADTSMSTDQSVPSGSYTKVEFDQLDNQQDYGLFDPSTHDMTILADGYHKIRASVGITSPGQNNKYELAIFVNGVEEKRFTKQSANNVEMSIPVHTNTSLDKGDVIDIRLRQDSGSNKTIESDSRVSEFHIDRKGI